MGRIGGLGFSRGRTAAALLLSAAWLAAQEPIPAGLARGIALLEEGRYEEAAGILGEAHRQEPGNLRVAIARTKALLEAARWPDALATAEELAGRFPLNAEAALLQGDCRLYAFDPGGAGEAYQRALEDPRWGSTALTKAATSLQLRRDEEGLSRLLWGGRAEGIRVSPPVEASSARLDPEPSRRVDRLRALSARLPDSEELRDELRLQEALASRGGTGVAFPSETPTVSKVREIYREPSIPLRLNGTKDTWIALDTGSDSLLLNEDLVRRLALPVLAETTAEGWGYRGRRRTKVVLVESFEAAGLRVNRLPALVNVRDSEFWSNKAGYIGLGPFLDGVIQYDRRKGRFGLWPPGTKPQAVFGDRGFTLPVLWHRGVPIVPVLLQGRGPFPFLLDTGAPYTLLSSQYATRVGIRVNSGKYGKLYGLGQSGAFTSGVAEQVRITLGPKSYDRRIIFVTDVPQRFPVPLYGILGRDVLNDYRMVFDGPGGQVTLQAYDGE
ncbi:MAG: aspartyl protease family protein [Acidobacteriota bacterium]